MCKNNFYSDHQLIGCFHALHLAGQLHGRLLGEPTDGRRPQQYRQDPKVVRRPRPVSRLSNSERNEVHPLSRNHSQSKSLIGSNGLSTVTIC
jgi:hypothetical protein